MKIKITFLTAGILLPALALVVAGGILPPAAHACGDTEPSVPGGLKVQGYSVINDPALLEALGLETECNCAEVLTILMENGFEIANVTGIQGPPGVVFTLARGTPGLSSAMPRGLGPPGVAIIKCGRAGSCAGSTGGCGDDHTGEGGSSGGGCETTP